MRRPYRVMLLVAALGCLAASCNREAEKNTQGLPRRGAAAAKTTPQVAAKPSYEPGTVLLSDDVEFAPVAPFVKMGAAWGNRAAEAHGTFGLFPGKATSPPHTHSGAYHGVVISGTMTHPFGLEREPAQLGPGSYWFVPAGEQHVTACVSKEPCLFYFHADGKFDFTPVKELTTARSEQAEAVAAGKLEWVRVAPFVEMAAAWGNRASEAHGTFGRFPAHAASPKHTHSGAYRAIVMRGTMTNPFGDDKHPPKMGPGSYWNVPANAPHITACISDEPCLFYFHSEGAFDFAPVAVGD